MVVRNKPIAICITFTVITVIGSLLNIFLGGVNETSLHLLLRFGLCCIGVGSLFIFEWLRKWPAYLVQVMHYLLSMLLVFAFVWLTGFFDKLHPNAYRDVFLNYTAAYVVFAIICIFNSRKLSVKGRYDKPMKNNSQY